jgi:SagB-type dehydrogenase family enzyme
MSSGRPERRFRRSRLLVGLWSGGLPVLMHADTLQEFRMPGHLVELLSRLGEWSTADELAASGDPVAADVLDALWQAGILEAEDDRRAGSTPPEELWHPLELAVHRRTAHVGAPRAGGDGAPIPGRSGGPGATAQVRLPAAAPLDAPLAHVLRTRRTLRRYAERPLSLEELSTLLHHAAGVVTGEQPGRPAAVVLRPFASAGARSELELYAVANAVDGLESGAWHYDPMAHGLTLVRARDEHQAALNRWVNAATGDQLNRDPAAVLIVTAVVERMARKYGHLAFSLIYKDVGCLLENLYLVATATRLAPCAIGGGDEPANSRWLGLDPLAESQVGCFLVGPAQ